MPKDLPPIEFMRKLLRYDPETGNLWWMRRTPDVFSHCQKPLATCNRWNARLEGKRAFTAKDGKGYFQGRIMGSLYRAHRVIWAISTGEQPKDQIDHINGDGMDNRIVNLRVASCAENSRNRGVQSNNTSGVVGVSWDSISSKWVSHIHHEKKRISLGCFGEKSDAAEARLLAEVKYGYHANHGKRPSVPRYQ